MIDQTTKLCAVVGNPVEHTLSPTMHNAAFTACELNYVYLAFRVADVGGAIAGVRALGIRGLSVMIPHKVEVMPWLDEITAPAQRVGAVNTVVNDEGHMTGYNTDGEGAMRSLEARTDLAGKRVILIGAGGAARSLAFSVRERGASLMILNRTEEKARELSRDVGCEYGSLSAVEAVREAQVVIQATSAGMYPHTEETLVPARFLSPGQIVFDIVYNPMQTTLLRQARSQGCEVIVGYEMLVYQGAAQFELWTGQEAPVDVMKQTVEAALRGPAANGTPATREAHSKHTNEGV